MANPETVSRKSPEIPVDTIRVGRRVRSFEKGLERYAFSKSGNEANESLRLVDWQWKLDKEGRRMATNEFLAIVDSDEVKKAGNVKAVNSAVRDRLAEINNNIELCDNEERKAYWHLTADSIERRTKKMVGEMEKGKGDDYLGKLRKFADGKTRGVDYKKNDFEWVCKGWKLGKDGRRMATEEAANLFYSPDIQNAQNLKAVDVAVGQRLAEMGKNAAGCESEEKRAYWELTANLLKRREKERGRLLKMDTVVYGRSQVCRAMELIGAKGKEEDKVVDGLWEFYLRRNSVARQISNPLQRVNFLAELDGIVEVSLGARLNGISKRGNIDPANFILDALADRYLGIESEKHKPRLTRERNERDWGNAVWWDLTSEAHGRMRETEGKVSKEKVVEPKKHLSWEERAKVAAVATVAELTAVGLIYLVTSW